MSNQDFLVTGAGNCASCKTPRSWDLLRENYRFYRFLTEVEDAIESELDELSLLSNLRLIVRRLITNSYWIQLQDPPLDFKGGVSVKMLYDEVGFGMTVQTVAFAPQTVSTVHNHGTWGIVAILKGIEKNSFFQRTPDSDHPDLITPTQTQVLSPGDIISFTSDAIHQVEAIANEPTITFNIYGETHHSKRFEFDVINRTAKNF